MDITSLSPLVWANNKKSEWKSRPQHIQPTMSSHILKDMLLWFNILFSLIDFWQLNFSIDSDFIMLSCYKSASFQLWYLWFYASFLLLSTVFLFVLSDTDVINYFPMVTSFQRNTILVAPDCFTVK